MNAPIQPGAARKFVTAGNARFTVRNATTGNRFTFRVRAVRDGAVSFVSVLTGSDNEAAYSYLGFIRGGDYIHGGRRAKIGPQAQSAQVFAWFWRNLDKLPAQVEVWHDGRCGRCARALTVPESVASGLGPECAGKLGAHRHAPRESLEAAELEMQRLEAEGDREQSEREEVAKIAARDAMEAA